MKRFLLILVVFASCKKDNGGETAPTSGVYVSSTYSPNDIDITSNIVYSTRPNANNKQYTSDQRRSQENGQSTLQLMLDIAVPPNATPDKKQPLVVVMHGGAFTSGSKEDVGPVALSYATAGYVAATINYRLTADNSTEAATFIQSVIHGTEDGMNAIRFLKSKANEYNIDTSKVVTVGFSAGGGISMINAVNYDALMNTSSDFPRISSKVQAAVSTGATLVQPGIPDPRIFLNFDKNDTPIMLYHANPTDGAVNTTWKDHVEPTQKLINESGNTCTTVAQPDKSHTVDLSVGSQYSRQAITFIYNRLGLKQ